MKTQELIAVLFILAMTLTLFTLIWLHRLDLIGIYLFGIFATVIIAKAVA